jgi:carboxypeptidase D
VLSKIPTLLFVGDQDLICNYIGIENMIKALSWNGETGLGVCLCVSFPSSIRPDCIIRLYRHNRGMSTRYLQVPG